MLSDKKNKTELVQALSATNNNRFKNKMVGWLRTQDMFGKRVQFTFKGKSSY